MPTPYAAAAARSVPVNGVRLHYEERGRGDAIVCIHGAGTSAQLWVEALETLGGLGRAIAYDRRGYGDSDRPEPLTPMNVAQHADDAAALLDALDARPAVLIARSYGGEVAIDLALRYADRVRALVLLEAAPVELLPAAADSTRALRDRLQEVAAQEGLDAVGKALIGELGADWDALDEQVRGIFTHNGPAVLADLQGEWLGVVDAAALAAVRQPVLLVAATDSPPEFREPNDVLAAALVDARTVMVEGGHLIDPADPVVLAFLREVLD